MTVVCTFPLLVHAIWLFSRVENVDASHDAAEELQAMA